EVSGHRVGAHPTVGLYHRSVAARDGNLGSVLIFEAVGGGQLLLFGVDAQIAAGDLQDAGVEIVDGVVAGDGTTRRLQPDMAVGIDLPDFGTSSGFVAIVGGKRVGMDREVAALRRRIAARDV